MNHFFDHLLPVDHSNATPARGTRQRIYRLGFGTVAVVIIWLNGAFGSGKTQTAAALARRMCDAHVADPELVGHAIHRMLPPAQRDDFQDRPQWRSAVAETLAQADRDAVGPIIVPMTLVSPKYFDEIVGTLRRAMVDLRHVTLSASPETLHRRLGGRTPAIASRLLGIDESWAIAQIPRCTSALADPMFGAHVDTDDRSLDEVVEAVAATVHVDLPRGRESIAASKVRQLHTSLRHIRF